MVVQKYNIGHPNKIFKHCERGLIYIGNIWQRKDKKGFNQLTGLPANKASCYESSPWVTDASG